MQEELKELESRIDQAIDLCQRLWNENSALRDQLLATQSENQKLNDKLATVANRLDTLLQAFPTPDDGDEHHPEEAS